MVLRCQQMGFDIKMCRRRKKIFGLKKHLVQILKGISRRRRAKKSGFRGSEAGFLSKSAPSDPENVQFYLSPW